MRTFIAVDLSPHVRSRVASFRDDLAEAVTGVKWVEPENLHVTLLFLGEVDDREVLAVCRRVSDVAAKHTSFAISVERFGCFPTPRRPRVLWVGIDEGADRLVGLHDEIETALAEQGGYRREERAYTPHITLGRVSGAGPGEALAPLLLKHAGWDGGSMPVTELHVLSSTLTHDGPEYAVLSRAKLAPAAK
jgi:2'-5' RNA ligase